MPRGSRSISKTTPRCGKYSARVRDNEPGSGVRAGVTAEPAAEADRGRHPGFSSFSVLAGGPGSLAVPLRLLRRLQPDGPQCNPEEIVRQPPPQLIRVA